MTPLEIEILFHYYTRAGDFREGDFSAPAVRQTIDAFTGELGLLELRENGRCGDYPTTYQCTRRAEVYLEHLLDIPLPIQIWTMPHPSARTQKGEGDGR